MSHLLNKKVKVKLEEGLQASPAALFVQEANRFNANIFLEKSGKRVNAKSIMGLMSLATSYGESLIIFAEGEDAAEAIDFLAAFMQKETV